MNAKFVCLTCAMLLSSSAAIANDESTSNEISLSGITQFTRPALGLANYGATPTMQSSKVSFGGSIEYRRWFGNNGFAAIYSVVASNASFSSVPSSWHMSLTRHEGVLSYVRRFFPHSKFNPYVSIGAGGFVTHGGLGVWANGIWIPQTWLGVDGQFQVRAATGFDLYHTRHFAIRAGYVVHWTRAPNFSDVTYHAARTFITEPQLGLLWRF
jgi:hypothetical protein